MLKRQQFLEAGKDNEEDFGERKTKVISRERESVIKSFLLGPASSSSSSKIQKEGRETECEPRSQ